MSLFGAIFRTAQPIPDDCRANFTHFYADTAWFGLLNGSTLAFTAIYAARLGATLHLLGLLSAAPAIVNLIFALPAGRWLEKNTDRAPIFWSSVLYRIFFALFIPLPWIFARNNSGQIWVILLITFIMNIPNTALTIGFNAMFGDLVPNEWRGYVAGVRNSLLAVVTVVFTLLSGEILILLPFPTNYQIVFGIGFVGAAMSSYHLWFLRTKEKQAHHAPLPAILSGDDLEGVPTLVPEPAVLNMAPHIVPRINPFSQVIQKLQLRMDVLSGTFGRSIGLLFFFHLAQYLAIPLFSVYMVDNLHFSDQTISFGTAVYNVTMFIGSTQLARMSFRLGNKKVIAYGIILISVYPVFMALSRGPGLYIFANLCSGMAWAMIGGALFNYLLEMAPENDRPAHMAWYNLAFNAAVLIGSLSSPLIAGSISIVTALFLFAFLRLLSGLAILRWG
jgi:MFS family permease